MSFLKWIVRELGFTKNTGYQKRYLNDTNIRTAVYMSFIVLILEVWMIIRYVHQRPGRTFLQYFDGEANYLILFSSALILLSFAFRYVKEFNKFTAGKFIAGFVLVLDSLIIIRNIMNNHAEKTAGELIFGLKYHFLLFVLAAAYFLYEINYYKKDVRKDLFGQVMNVIFSLICVGFGIETSIYDISMQRQITCFVTMILFVACMLIWRPYISAIILAVSFLYFYNKWLPSLMAIDEAGGKAKDGDTINYFILWIVMVMISFSIYHQRRLECEKDEELIAANREINRKAVMDDLTGIHNMLFFNQETVEVLHDPDVDPANKIFLFLNIENFKTYNDQFGYRQGNEFLVMLADLIKATFMDDPVARLSDDHFVVLTDIDGAKEKVDAIRKAIHTQNQEVYLELKVGGYKPKDRDIDPRIAIDSARYACSLTKNKFGVNYREYDENVDNQFHMNQYIVNHIDKAVQEGHIKVYYQPVVWSDTRELCGLEALARWDDPQYGFLSPGVFIPVLEEYRQIHKLDQCVFEQVCQNMQDAIEKGRPVVPVSLNFSRLDFELMDAVGILEGYVQKYRISKDFLHVEVTESALADNEGLVKESIDKLHQEGYSVWLDDFGSGYSSLNVLKDFNFDVLKIDMKFLTNFEKNSKSKIILDTIIKLADGIGMMSLTEGVETEEAADYLREAGCGRLQGFLFGKPMPLKNLHEKIDDGTYKVSEKLT